MVHWAVLGGGGENELSTSKTSYEKRLASGWGKHNLARLVVARQHNTSHARLSLQHHTLATPSHGRGEQHALAGLMV